MILFAVVILLLFVLGLRGNEPGVFSKDIVTVLKPILAFGIILHHLHGETVFLHEFERWGPLIVGIFFFISGYGLTYSYERKPDYLKNFFTEKILVKLVLPCFFAWCLNLFLNYSGKEYSFIGHLTNASGPSFFSNDWFIYALIYCYISFLITAKIKSGFARLTFLFSASLFFVVYTSGMGYARNWWATPLAFPIGAIYCKLEYYIREFVSDKKRFVYSNVFYIGLFGILIVISALFKSHITTVLAYSLLPLLLVNILIRIDISKLARNRIILFLGGISFEIYLIHGIIIDFLRDKVSLSGVSLILTTLIVVLVISPLFKGLCTACQKWISKLKPQAVTA